MADLTLDITASTKSLYTYSLKKYTGLILKYDSDIADCEKTFSGNTMTINFVNTTYKFTNISNTKEFSLTIQNHDPEPSVLFNGTLQEFYNEYAPIIDTPTKGTTVTGTVFGDTINVSGYMTGGLTINAADGDDKITGTAKDDKITGGTGENTINLFTTQIFGDDVVNLTKGEDIVFKLDAGTTEYTKCYLNGKDFVLEVYDSVVTAPGAMKTGSVTIKNWAAKDVMTNTGSMFLTDGTNPPVNLRAEIVNYVKMDSGHYNKSSFNGVLYNDNVDASDYTVIKNGEAVTEDSANYAKTKGVTINLNGGIAESDGNVATGSIYADTLKGGADNDILRGGHGSDVITGGAGVNDVLYAAGDGADTYNVTKGEDLQIRLDDLDTDDFTFTYANGTKDVKMTRGLITDSITLKNFGSKDITSSAIVFGQYEEDSINIKEEVRIKTTTDKNFTGTYLKDDIDASSATKAVTLNGGAGNDILKGGQGNDKLTGGAGNDEFHFDPTATIGVDTITDASAGDTIVISDAGGTYPAENLKFVKNGNNLELYFNENFDPKNKIVVQNHFKKAEDERIDLVKVNGDEIYISEANLTITGSGKIDGTNNDDEIIGSIKNDTIKGYDGDDKIWGVLGNNTIYGGKGDDLINAGAGKNNICYSLGDGDDTIIGGNGVDTLVFDKGIEIEVTRGEDDWTVTYSGSDSNNNPVSNTITLEDFEENGSVQYIKIGSEVTSIYDWIEDDSIYGTNGNDSFKSTEEDETYILKKGNDKVTFGQDFGSDDIYSRSIADKGNTDTLTFSNYGFTNNNLWAMVEAGDAEGEYNLLVDAWEEKEVGEDWEEHGGSVTYHNITAEDAPNIKITDKNGSYMVNAFTEATEQDWSSDSNGHITYVMTEEEAEGTSVIKSNGKYSQLNVSGGAALEYTYNGGKDKLYIDTAADDIYNVDSLSSSTSFLLRDQGGEDTMNFSKTNVDDIRLVFDVSLDGESYTYYKNDLAIFAKGGLTKTTFRDTFNYEILESANVVSGVRVMANGDEGDEGIEHFSTKDYENVSLSKWQNYIAGNVAEWLNDNEYGSVWEALEDEELTDTQFTQLYNLFSEAKYSDIPEAANEYHITSDGDADLSLEEGDNVVIFDDAPILGYGNTIISSNTSGNGYTDTIDMSGKNEEGEGVSFMDTSLRIYGSNEGQGYTDDLWLDATAYPGCPGDGNVIYKNFYTEDAADVIIKDSDREYSAKGYSGATEIELDDDTTNRVIAIKADEGTSEITSNGNYNHITTFGGAELEYTYGGGYDNVWSLESDTDDTYNVELNSQTSVAINDWGGDNDALVITGTTQDNLENNMRILFDVEKNSWSEEWQYSAGRYMLTLADNADADALSAAVTWETGLAYGGINVGGNDSQIETVTVNGEEFDLDAWRDEIMDNVVSWLESNGYDSVYDAVCGDEPCEDLTELIACYTAYNPA